LPQAAGAGAGGQGEGGAVLRWEDARHPVEDGMKFRFGIQFIGARTRDEWVEAARRAEGLGFSTLVLPDHFGGGQLAPMPALMAAADATSTLRLGTLVLCND